MADKPDENIQKALEAGKAAKAKSDEEFAARTKGKPTPTQDELNRINLGEHILEKEEDGADPDLNAMPLEHRAMQAEGGAGYKTRQAQPRQSYPAGSRPTTGHSS